MKRILVVDDDYDICEALQLLLEPQYAVSIANNGQQALERLLSEPFDAVVLDLMMPVMDGESLMGELSRRGIDIPVVFASAASHLADRARIAGAAGWVKKPFDARQLESMLERILSSGGPPGSSGRGPAGTPGERSPEGGTGARSLHPRGAPRFACQMF